MLPGRDQTGHREHRGLRGEYVHETLKKCYDDAKFSRLHSLEELLAYYDDLWQKRWHDSIVIVKKDLGQDALPDLRPKRCSQATTAATPLLTRI